MPFKVGLNDYHYFSADHEWLQWPNVIQIGLFVHVMDPNIFTENSGVCQQTEDWQKSFGISMKTDVTGK